jgi:hypothetical protein
VEPPDLPANDPRGNLETYYASILPVANGSEDTAPDPTAWTPFGECISGLSLTSSWERCSYEMYSRLYQVFGTSLKLKYVLMLAFMNEFGDEFDPTKDLPDTLSQPMMYALEAATRNFADGCASVRGVQPQLPISCDVRGVSALLLQVQSIYQKYNPSKTPEENVKDIIERGAPNTGVITLEEFTEKYGTFALSNPDWVQGIIGIVPFQWGNFLSDHISYVLVDGILNDTSSAPSNVIPQSPWIYVDPSDQSPLLINTPPYPSGGNTFAIKRIVTVTCSETAVITIVSPGLGQTEIC